MNLPLGYFAKVALKSPSLFRSIMEGSFRKFIGAPLEYFLGDGRRASRIKQIDIKITNLCNLRCKMCAQWGQSGYNFGRPAQLLREVLPVQHYKRMVDDCLRMNPLYYIWGGEPLMYPGIMELLGYIKSRRQTVSVITNGTLLESRASEIVRMGVDSVMISLDGPAEVHDRIRGVPGTFEKMAAGLSALLRERARRKKGVPILVLLMTLTGENYRLINKTLQVAQDLGADFAAIYYSWFTTEEIGCAHTRFMEEHFGVTPTAWRGYLSDACGMDTLGLIEEIRKVRAVKYRIPYLFVPDLNEEEIPKYFNEPEHTFGHRRCVSPWYVTEISPNGDVATCRDYPDYTCGNIGKESLLKIFNGPRYGRFRAVLREKGLFPICARCCGLIGF